LQAAAEQFKRPEAAAGAGMQPAAAVRAADDGDDGDVDATGVAEDDIKLVMDQVRRLLKERVHTLVLNPKPYTLNPKLLEEKVHTLVLNPKP
jgi:hypothetical protein